MLKYQVDDINELEEPLRTHYAREGDEGPFRLTLELPADHSVENVSGLKGALRKERDNNKTLAARISELEGGDANEHRKLAGRVEELATQNTKLLGALNEQKVKSTCTEAIAAAKGVPALLLPVLTQRVAVESDVVVVKDDKGNVLLNPEGLPITVAEFVNTLRGRDEYGGAFLGTGSSGGGAPSSSGNGGHLTVTKRRSEMTIAEKASFLKEHGTERFMELSA